MSAIGRIFIVLNLILAAGFLGWASSALTTVEDYKGQLADKQAELDTLVQEKDDEISAITNERDARTDESRTAREERDDAAARVTELEGLLADEQRKNSDMQGRLAKIDATLGDYNSTISTLTQQKDDAVQRANDAERERDDANDAQQAAELAKRDSDDAVAAANQQISALEGQVASLEGEVTGLNSKLDTIAALYPVDIDDISAVPEINGAVLSASFDTKPGLVMLNVGSDAGVRRGITFHIWRGSQYKGEARVETVQADFCSAVITGVNGDNTMAQGDRASTIL